MSQALDPKEISAVARAEKIDPAIVQTISDAAVRHNVDPYLLLAVGKQETDFGRGAGYNRATGRGDGGHGYGMFQLDDRTASHRPNLEAVAKNPGKAADVASGMLREALDHSHGDTSGALRYYNSGNIRGTTTLGEYHGHRVPYEVAVRGREDEFRTEAGHAAGVEPPHRPQTPITPASPERRNSVVFIRQEHILRVVDGRGNGHEFPAYNNTANPKGDPNVRGSHGPAPDGKFPLGTIDRGMANGEFGSYGPVGAIPIGGATGSNRGLYIHSGRGDNPTHPTYGCIRTTDEAMRFMRDNQPNQITIEETRSLNQRHSVSNEMPKQPNINEGSTGRAVVALQKELGVTADGFFGPKTEAAVRKFQAEHHLTADGIVGAHTREALATTKTLEHRAHKPDISDVQHAVDKMRAEGGPSLPTVAKFNHWDGKPHTGTIVRVIDQTWAMHTGRGEYMAIDADQHFKSVRPENGQRVEVNAQGVAPLHRDTLALGH